MRLQSSKQKFLFVSSQMLADMPPQASLQGIIGGLQAETSSINPLLSNNSNTTTILRNKKGKRKHRRQKKKRRKNQDGKQRRRRKHGHKKGGHLPNNNHKGRVIRSSLFSSEDDPPWKEVPPPDSSDVQSGACSHWLMDECSWPQCNRACPRLHNPFTGEEMDFMELLKSFGLDMVSVANALGIDLATLNEMDNDTLLQLLTQQTN